MAQTTTRLGIPYAELTDSNNLAYVSQALAERVDTFAWPTTEDTISATTTASGWTINGNITRVGPNTGLLALSFKRTSSSIPSPWLPTVTTSIANFDFRTLFSGWGDIQALTHAVNWTYPGVFYDEFKALPAFISVTTGGSVQLGWYQYPEDTAKTITTADVFYFSSIPVKIAG